MTNKNIVGLALAAVLLPGVVSAATVEELQAQINALMAQLSAAKPATTASCSVVLSKSLKAGMSDAEVMDLQKALNSDVATQVAASGVGSAGNETMYFGAATKAAVVKFQNKYASEVLAPAGLSAGTGFVGAATRAKINALCSGAVVSTPTTTTGTPAPVTGLNGSAGSATVTNYTSDNDTTVVTGVAQTVAGFKVKADGSDIAVSHVKVTLTQTNSGYSTYLNRYFDSIDVYANGSKVASVKADDFNRDAAGQYSKTIALDNKVVVKMGASNQTTFTFKAIGASSIDSANIGALWNIDAGYIRYSDATGAVLSGSDHFGASGIAVNKLSTSSDVKVRFSTGSANPDVKTNFISDTSSGDKVVMNEFKIKAEGTKLSFDQVKATTTSSLALSNMISELQLVQNGSVIDTVDPTSSDFATSTGVASFNLDNLVTINQDETATFQIVAKMQKIGTATFTAGATSTISFSTINAQDANGDVIKDRFFGSADGREQTFLSTGVNVTKVSSSVAATTNTQTAGASFGTFTYDVKVTASGDDVWVPFTASSTGNAGAMFSVEDSNNNVVSSGTTTASFALVSGGTRDGNTVKIADGESATLEVVVTYDPTAAGQYRLQIGSIGYNSTSAATGATLTIAASPESDFQSSNLFITN